MLRMSSMGSLGQGLILLAYLGSVPAANAQTVVESSIEARFQLDVQVPEAALMAHVPPGFTVNVSARGPATDANLRVVFIDRTTINGPDGAPVGKGSNRLVYLIAPVTDPDGNRAQLVIGGLTEDPADAPGPFGVYLPATTQTRRQTASTGSGAIVEEQDWVFTAPTGEHIEMHIVFERGPRNRGSNPSETRFYSARDPGTYEISRQQQMLDILRNVTTNPPDRVSEFSFRAGGGSYAALFGGAERVLSWDHIRWVDRTILRP